MKPGIFLLSVAGLLLLQSGCQFDRTALSRQINGQSVTLPSNDAAAAANPEPDAASVLLDAAMVANSNDASTSEVDAQQPPTVTVDDDSGTTTGPTDPPAPPMTGGLQCHGTFCPFATDPAKPCCTTQADVDKRTARGADRCGLDLSGLMSSTYQGSCWQRDQPGIVDDSCPSAMVKPNTTPGTTSEPGCCTDDGECGTFNDSQKLGCRHQLGSARRACSDAPGNRSCDPTGTFGVRVTADATWGGRSGGIWTLTDDGRGKIYVYVMLSIDNVNAATQALSVTGRVCGVTFPAFYSTTLCESYQPIFPNTIWEAPEVPKPAVSGRYECSDTGCVTSIDPYTYLIGFQMNNPEAPWPTAADTATLMCAAGEGTQCFPDDDSDTRPGVQINLATTGNTAFSSTSCQNGYAYRGAPLSASPGAIFNGVRRTDRIELGARMKVGLSVRTNDDCMSARGSAVAEYVNSRAAGCMVEAGTNDFGFNSTPAGTNDRCAAAEASFVDQNLPVYQLLAAGKPPASALKLSDKSASTGPQASVLRLGDANAAISCSDVRMAKY